MSNTSTAMPGTTSDKPIDMTISALSTDMRDAWYPLSLACDLLPGDVVGLHLLGDPVCLYRDRTGRAACLSDRCAHRSAPLSIGRVRDAELECKYHGWKYSTDGRVIAIPALLPDRDIPANATVYAYPLVERDGLIWVWPGRAERADPATILRLNPNADDPKRWTRPFVMATDLDIDHALMVENLLDPAHLPFTHEGTLSKRANAKPLRMDVDVVEVDWCSPESGDVKGEVDDKGVIVDKNVVDDTKNVLKKHGVKVLRGNSHFSTDDKSQGYFHFIPPCHVVLRHTFANGYKFHQTMHCVPTRPGHMRLIYMQSRDFMTFVNVLERLPLIRDYIQMQDYELLHGQQARLLQGSKAWHSPIQVDGMPKLYREWLRKAMSRTYPASTTQDDYTCVVLRKGPYFQGWKPCGTSSSTTTASDIEDLTHPCQHDCSVPHGSQQGIESVDERWTVPKQRNVNNEAYTWRRDEALGRGRNSGWGIASLLAVGTAAVALAVGLLKSSSLIAE